MKRLLWIGVVLALALPALALVGHAQDAETEEKIASAMSAAPLFIARDATILDYPSEEGGDFVELRAGTNGWTCFPDWDANPGNDPMCLDQTWMQWADAWASGTEPNITTLGLSYMLQGGSDASNTDPYAVEPAPGEDWITSGPHVMILSPNPLDSTHFSTDHNSGEPYVMWPGTPYEHIMVPVDAESLSQRDDPVQGAMSAAPLAVAQNATLLDFPADPTAPLIELRAGTNGWTCFTDWPGTPTYDPMCLDAPWAQVFDALAAGTEPEVSTVAITYMLQGSGAASNTDPFALEPEPGEDWVTDGPSLMVLSPVPLDTSLFSTDHTSGGPYIMWAGTPYEHIMMPVEAGPAMAVAGAEPVGEPAALPATGAPVGLGPLVALLLTGLGLVGGGLLARRQQLRR